jgi:hypothetical protein
MTTFRLQLVPAWIRVDWRTLLLYLGMALALSFTDHRMRRFPDYVVTTYVPQVVQGTADAPGRYRVLAPLIIDALTRATGGSPIIVFLAIRFGLLYAALVAAHLMLRNWFPHLVATGGTAMLAALLPLTYTNSWAHPDSVVELLLLCAGCAVIVSKRDGWFSAVLILAAFNRETSAFLLLLWAWQRLAETRSRAMLVRVMCVGSAWWAVFLGLRWIRGFASYEYWMLPRNIAALVPLPGNFDPYVRISGLLWLFLAVPLFTLAVAGVRRVGWRSYFGRATVVAGCLLLTGFAISSVLESRIFVPLLPLLVPPALVGLGAEPPGPADDASRA